MPIVPPITPTTQFQIGKTLYPVTASQVNTALFEIDKPVAYLLDFTAACINAYVGGSFAVRLANHNITTFPHGLIGSTLPYNPAPYLLQEGLQFPILACWRGDFKVSELDISQHRVETVLHWLYIWQPLTAGNAEILLPFMEGVKNVIIHRNEYGNDASYNDGYSIAPLAGYDSVGVKSGARFQMEVPGGNNATQLPFESIYIEMTLRETNTALPVPNTQFVPITGFDASLTLVEQNQPDWQHFEDLSSTP